MGKVKIKNTGTPIMIGNTLCPGNGAATPVDEKELKKYTKNPAGAYVFKKYITVIDEDYEKRVRAEREALENTAIEAAKKKVRPLLEKEITVEVGKKFEKEIKGLTDKITALVSKNESLAAEIETLNAAMAGGDDAKTDKGPGENLDPDGFKFDPEKHHIEHRGGGSWFVMELEEKVYGPLTDEERTKFEDLLK